MGKARPRCYSHILREVVSIVNTPDLRISSIPMYPVYRAPFTTETSTPAESRRPISIEWVFAAIPLYVWLVAYFFEQGTFIAAGVPRVLSELGFTNMLNASVFAAALLVFPAAGAWEPVQRVYNEQRRAFFIGMALVTGIVVAFAVVISQPGRRLLSAAFSMAFVGLLLGGFLIRRYTDPNGYMAERWKTSLITRIVLVFVYAEIVCASALGFGYMTRNIKESFTVLESKCGPAVEVFQRTGDSFVLLHHGDEMRVELRSLSGSGPLQVGRLSVDEIEFRRAITGPCPKW